MDKSTDLEICKRIAEIEGLESRFTFHPLDMIQIKTGDEWKEYNPLTGWNLTGPLMVKHEISFGKQGGRYFATAVVCETFLDVFNKDPQKAICLAIIEKRNG